MANHVHIKMGPSQTVDFFNVDAMSLTQCLGDTKLGNFVIHLTIFS